ncbi:acylneuraminate cytidylyltransferase [Arcobacter sp. AHV-9/2010]|uniref:cytidylyltransferase domain-containing protein n=1 Tax=Arcobacter sp. AHV-9/2010 TaxID=2021861 RepID=UPI00100BC43E|nr:acylneuraminate cytidylyltransferase [Arcobacter sp. CECT 9299]RXJ95857.1 acylneuraminate cytidylyltransferase [Arcobacter sp. CECT 9299]
MNILAVIPARGGSKGIPRKNLRLLNGKPLIYYAINTALKSKYNIDVYVSSEDDEILSTASTFGAKIHKRDMNIADDKTTLDPVIYDCYLHAKEAEQKEYDYIITMQPTSPLLKTISLDKAIEKAILGKDIETVIAAKDDTHLSWRKEEGRFLPNYKERVNRQYLTPTFTETGAFFITRVDIITSTNRIGKNVELQVLSNGEEIDIDTYDDWNLCEYHLQRKHIVFVVTGNNEVGLGHVYNTLLIANDILNHKITFLVDKKSMMAYEKIASRNYPVFIQQNDEIIEDIKKLNADIIINDRLDTDENYITQLKSLNLKVINFEDLGEGAKKADLVINAIYPEKQLLPKHYFGHDYFILRDEFIYSKEKKIKEKVKNILISFGGVDPNNYTKKVIEAIYKYCQINNISITVISGFGYTQYETLKEFTNIQIKKNVSNISKYMLEADLIFTSAGRTTYEIASIATPAIVLAQNERELTHFFANSEFGFLNLGLGYTVTSEELYKNFIELVHSFKNRKYMSELMKKIDLKNGRKTVIKLIQNLIEVNK